MCAREKERRIKAGRFGERANVNASASSKSERKASREKDGLYRNESFPYVRTCANRQMRVESSQDKATYASMNEWQRLSLSGLHHTLQCERQNGTEYLNMNHNVKINRNSKRMNNLYIVDFGNTFSHFKYELCNIIYIYILQYIFRVIFLWNYSTILYSIERRIAVDI